MSNIGPIRVTEIGGLSVIRILFENKKKIGIGTVREKLVTEIREPLGNT
jgi:hypothetical protein